MVADVLNRLNAPLFVGRLVLNRWLLVVLASIFAGYFAGRLAVRGVGAPATESTFSAALAGIVVWKLAQVVRNINRVVRDPAIILGLRGTRVDILIGAVAAAGFAVFAAMRRPRAIRGGFVRGSVQSAATMAAAFFVCALVVAALPVPPLRFAG